MASYIHLIRHGITEGNKSTLFYGVTDLPLTEDGIENLKELRKQGIYPLQGEGADEEAAPPDFYITSLQRTRQTLELLYGTREAQAIAELSEINCGIYEMRTIEELRRTEPDFEAWASDEDESLKPPGGESVGEFRRRVGRGWQQVIARHRLKELSVRHNGKDAHSIVICHGGVIGAIMVEILPEEQNSMWSWVPDPGRGYTLTMEQGKVSTYVSI